MRFDRTSRCSSSTRSTTSQTLAYRDELSARWGSEPDQSPGEDAERRAVAGESTGSLLQAAQGRAAVLGPRRIRHVVHSAAPRSVAVAREPAGSRAVQASGEDDLTRLAARRVDCARRVEVRQGARHPAAAAVRVGLHEYRLRAVHGDSVRSREPALGPLAGPEARMRHSYSGEINVSERAGSPSAS